MVGVGWGGAGGTADGAGGDVGGVCHWEMHEGLPGRKEDLERNRWGGGGRTRLGLSTDPSDLQGWKHRQQGAPSAPPATPLGVAT